MISHSTIGRSARLVSNEGSLILLDLLIQIFLARRILLIELVLVKQGRKVAKCHDALVTTKGSRGIDHHARYWATTRLTAVTARLAKADNFDPLANVITAYAVARNHVRLTPWAGRI